MASTSASSSVSFSGLATLADPSAPRSISALDPSSSHPAPALVSSSEADSRTTIHGLTGRSQVMRRLIQQMHRMAPHLILATIEGEEGTGRTLAARALHATGPAPDGPFVPCLATQFFAQDSLSATEPERRQPQSQSWSEAVLRAAHGGMLFLDRVHQLNPEQQESLAHFLHWFDDRHFRALHPVATASRSAAEPCAEESLPAQIVFSTSVSLRNPGSLAGFREDLASRLCSVRFHLPPLTQRREDIPLLAQVFIQRFARIYGKPVRGLGPGAIAPLLRYPWPGNVRELEETITAAAQQTESQWIRPIDLPPMTANLRQGSSSGSSETSPDSDFNLDHAIRSHVNRVLTRTKGNKLRAAQLLGISRSTLYRILAAQPGATQSPAHAVRS